MVEQAKVGMDFGTRMILEVPGGRRIEAHVDSYEREVDEWGRVEIRLGVRGGMITQTLFPNYEAAWRPNPDDVEGIQTTKLRADSVQEVLDHLASHWDVDPAEVVYVKELKRGER